jgi:hypothetical protein
MPDNVKVYQGNREYQGFGDIENIKNNKENKNLDLLDFLDIPI